MAVGTDIVWSGFATWEALLSPRIVRKVLREQVNLANKRLGPKFVAKVRDEIKQGQYASNARLTELLKGSTKPLVDDGDLWASVNSRQQGSWEFHVGVKRQSGRDARGRFKEGVAIGLVLHEGVTIKVTPQVRAFFRAKAAETRGLVKPLKSSTGQIRIPARPFLKAALVDDTAKVRVLLEQEWGAAIRRTYDIVGRKHGERL